jgi:hypothetical protein
VSHRQQLIFTGFFVTVAVIWLGLRIAFGQITWAIGGVVVFAIVLWAVWRSSLDGKSRPRRRHDVS